MIRKGLITLLFCFYMVGFVNAQTDSISPGLNDSLLIVYLRTNYTPSSPKNYNAARDSMYQFLDVDETDSLTCVYSGLRAEADGTRTPEFVIEAANPLNNDTLSFNTEHSWPQSFYDNAEPMRGDIHHLFPTWSSPNQSRSNHPFGEIDDNLTTSWWYWENGGSVSSTPSSNIDEYSEYYNDTFEPREDHKGNAARAMFYFWTLYQTNTDIINDTFDNEAFFEGMKQTLYDWHQQDPVDAAELARSLEVEGVQGNRNPFIHDTTLVRRAYFYETSSSSSSNEDVFISEVYEANGAEVKYVELFNNSDSTVNLASGEWSLLRYTNEGTSVSSSISLTGTIASKSFYVIGDNNSSTGVQTIFDSVLVDQNTTQINHNGNDKYVLIKNASSSADTIDSFAKDNIGSSSNFAQNQVAYRVFSALPNDGSFGQTSASSSGDTVASGNWVVFNVTSSNANAGLIATPGYSKGIESSKKTEALVSGAAQWRLLSIPADNTTLTEISDDTAIQGVDDASASNVFTYNSSGSFDTPSTTSSALTNGEGIAVYFYNNTLLGSSELPIILDVGGTEASSNVSVSLNTTTVESSSYFTLVGNPFQSNFDGNSITSDNPIQSNIHLIENGLYFTQSLSSTVILPWQGFWVESGTASPATTLTFPVSGKTNSVATTSAFSKIAGDSYSLKFNLKSNKSYDRGCIVDFKPDAKTGWDIHDASKLSPVTNEYATIACLEQGKTKSVHSLPLSLEDIEIDLVLESVNVDNALELSWVLDENFPSRLDAFLEDRNTGTTINLRDDSSYSFTEASVVTKSVHTTFNHSFLLKNKPSRFMLSISELNQVDAEYEPEIPLQFKVHQNYPNPFNPSTQIGFELPGATPVEIKVYNTKGSLVRILVNEVYNQGKHNISFDGKNLASGIYFYTLKTKFGIRSNRMLLIK